MSMITDKHIEIYQNVITDVRESLGRNAVIYLEPTKTVCTWCIKDPVSGLSSGLPVTGVDWDDHPDYVSPLNDKICPNCNGKGDTVVDITHTVLCTRKNLDYNDKEDDGVKTYRPGTLRLSCNLNLVLIDSADANSKTYFDDAIKVVYDGYTYDVVNVTKGGLGELFTCMVILEKRNKE